jgi:dTDP-4-dehydrorhamnose reductase
MTRRALVFGALGQVGTALRRTTPASWTAAMHDVAETDIRQEGAVSAAIHAVHPDVIINCAAFTNVDGAETSPAEAREVNTIAPGIIAAAAARAGARFIHISTDYVFDGQAHTPYLADAPTAPQSVYGRTKCEGEERVREAAPSSAIVRTAWVHSGGGANFVRTCVRHLSAGRAMRVVDDQIGTPTRAHNLALALWRIAERIEITGTLHFTDSGVASWFDVAAVVLETLRAAARLPEGAAVLPIRTGDYPTVARRPAYSVLDKHDSWRAIEFVPPHWREGVAQSTSELLDV